MYEELVKIINRLLGVIYSLASNNKRGKLIMAVTFQNIDKVPVEISEAVDAEGIVVPIKDAVFEWSVESSNGKDLGTFEVDAVNPTAGVFLAGIAGAEGFIRVRATFPDGTILEGATELIKLVPSKAVAFTLKLGEPIKE